MKPDEQRLLCRVAEHAHSPRELIKQLGMNPKRGEYLLRKWFHKDWYDFGVVVDLGWLTPEGQEAARAVAEAHDKPDAGLAENPNIYREKLGGWWEGPKN